MVEKLIINLINLKMKWGISIKSLISKQDLIELGYKEHTASSIIKQAKTIMVYNRKVPFYNNRRLGLVPRDVVESLIGVRLDDKE